YPNQVWADSINPAIVRLRFTDSFPVRTPMSFHVHGLTDNWNNPMQSTQRSFAYYQPQFADVLIHEIMADPSPAVGLPETEWIELYNRSGFDVPLTGWRFGKPGSLQALPEYLLPADSFLILCSTSAANQLKAFGNVMGLSSFPSLSNEGDSLWLQSAEGRNVHAVAYQLNWYQNELKQSGGWSLEMMDPLNPCAGAGNWKASEAPIGGTPGHRNSVSVSNPDEQIPRLLRAYASDSTHVWLWMDEPLDSIAAANPLLYSISEGIGSPDSVSIYPPFFTTIRLSLSTPLQRYRLYEVMVQSIRDCVGNISDAANRARVALAERADSLDVLINEVLFNPATDGADFVELYQHGKNVINLMDLYIANRNTAGELANITPVSTTPDLLFPGDYRVLTSDPAALQRKHVVSFPDRISFVDLPSMNDDTGQVIILYKDGRVLDQLGYSDRWHFPLLIQTEEVSLERLQFSAPTQSADNWMSAAETAGFATPTYANSQQKREGVETGTITLDPPVLTPDGDGQDDVLLIWYRFTEPGNVAQVRIYDLAGRLVRTIAANSLCGLNGYFRWDGLTEQARSVPA
ncbi:MAG TPA: lamin tail domain-containing protein, partial [Ferruginibacter sp.]|nr:lamin tail domain-containing protein [Ferruginibacter sp.]